MGPVLRRVGFAGLAGLLVSAVGADGVLAAEQGEGSLNAIGRSWSSRWQAAGSDQNSNALTRGGGPGQRADHEDPLPCAPVTATLVRLADPVVGGGPAFLSAVRRASPRGDGTSVPRVHSGWRGASSDARPRWRRARRTPTSCYAEVRELPKQSLVCLGWKESGLGEIERDQPRHCWGGCAPRVPVAL